MQSETLRAVSAAETDTSKPQADLAAPLVMTAVDIAWALQVSERTVRRLDRQGRLPKPLKIGGRALRWRRDEFRDWLAAGCPHRNDWHWQPGGAIDANGHARK